MRILHVTDNYGSIGGIQSYLRNLAELFGEKGHTIEIYSPSESRENFHSYLSRWVSYRDYAAVKKLIEQFKPDILHGHSVSMRISPLPFLAARKKGIPVVMTVHDFGYVCPRKWMIDSNGEPCSHGFGFRCLISNCPASMSGWRYLPYQNLRWLKTALHRQMLSEYVHTFVCPSEVLARWMRDSLKASDIVCIPNFVERKPSRAGIQTDSQLLFVGRLSEEKGVDCLLKAMPCVLKSFPDAFLTIVGDGPVRQKIESLSHSLGIEANVRFAGMVENERLDTYYRRAAICVIPSLWMENCPVTALEALAFGVPLIGSDIGGIPAMIQDGRTGFLFRKDDPGNLAEKVSLLLKNRSLLSEFRYNSISFFEGNFTKEKHYEQMLTLYASLVTQ